MQKCCATPCTHLATYQHHTQRISEALITPANIFPVTMAPNQFLINNSHAEYCFCVTCRNQKCAQIIGTTTVTRDTLLEAFMNGIPREDDEYLNELFKNTLIKIAVGVAYKHRCLRNTRYTSFGAWLGAQPPGAFANINTDRLCARMTHVTYVFQDWDTIIHNLTNPQMVNIDARKFSIIQFYRARNFGWCVRYNNMLGSPPGGVNERPEYDEGKYQALIDLVQSSQLLEDVSRSTEQARLISKRFHKDLQDMCME